VSGDEQPRSKPALMSMEYSLFIGIVCSFECVYRVSIFSSSTRAGLQVSAMSFFAERSLDDLFAMGDAGSSNVQAGD
jgi:hypothetical protein